MEHNTAFSGDNVSLRQETQSKSAADEPLPNTVLQRPTSPTLKGSSDLGNSPDRNPGIGQAVIEEVSNIPVENSHSGSLSMHQSSGTNGSKPSLNKRGAIFRAWREELISLLVGLIVLVATIVILSQFNDERQPSWPYVINLNTLIALLSTVFRSMLLVVAEGSMNFHPKGRALDTKETRLTRMVQ